MDKYTKFILTVIAVAMIGIFFKVEKIISPAHAIESHSHNAMDIYDLGMAIRMAVNKCTISHDIIMCWDIYGI